METSLQLFESQCCLFFIGEQCATSIIFQRSGVSGRKEPAIYFMLPLASEEHLLNGPFYSVCHAHYRNRHSGGFCETGLVM